MGALEKEGKRVVVTNEGGRRRVVVDYRGIQNTIRNPEPQQHPTLPTLDDLLASQRRALEQLRELERRLGG